MRSVCEVYHIKPWEIARLTLAELVWLCEDEEKKSKSDEDIQHYVEQYQEMSCLERIRAAREGRI